MKIKTIKNQSDKRSYLKRMKEAWYLVSNREELSGSQMVKFYGKRWTIEPILEI